MLSLLALLRFSLIKSREWSTAQLDSSTKLQNLLTLLLDLHWLLRTSPSCFTSILLLVLFVKPQVLGFSVSQGCAGGLLGRDHFSISDLSSGTLFLSLSGMRRHSPLSSQNWKPTSSLLPTDLSLSFFCFHQTHDYYACVLRCMCVCECGVLCMCGRKCLWHAYLLCKRPGLSWDGAP